MEQVTAEDCCAGPFVSFYKKSKYRAESFEDYSQPDRNEGDGIPLKTYRRSFVSNRGSFSYDTGGQYRPMGR